MQDVFVRAYGALRADEREINLRAWLYRVAHNRCIDHLRRPMPPAAEIFEMSRKPLHDPIEEAQRREDLARLVEDVGRLPEQQRSALLMREIDGMSYADLAAALDVTVPAVKSLLVRARVGLVEAAEARDADCCEIRDDLLASYDRGVKASGRARRHMRSCCRLPRVPHGAEGHAALVRRAHPGRSASAGSARSAPTLLGLGGGGAAAGGSAAAAAAAAAAADGRNARHRHRLQGRRRRLHRRAARAAPSRSTSCSSSHRAPRPRPRAAGDSAAPALAPAAPAAGRTRSRCSTAR